jgi:hypothetical protein
MHYNLLQAHETVNYTFPYTVPENAYIVTIYSKIESADTTCEICFENNTKMLMVPVLEGPWINDVHLSPNPFSNGTGFYYELGRDMESITIGIFTAEGKKLTYIMDCPSGMGSHVVNWEPVELNTGSYYFRFTGTDADGKKHEYADKFVKL